MKQKTIWLLIGLLLLKVNSLKAQEINEQYIDSVVSAKIQTQQASGTSKFLLTGYSFITAMFSKYKSSFSSVGISPILLWKPNESVLVEAELEMSIAGNQTMIELGYADASFFVNKYLTIRAGKFTSPFGIFQDRLHPGWINKLPTVPVGTGEDDLGVGPISEIGIDVRGGAPLGTAKINYSVFLANGAQLITDPAAPDKQGTLTYGNAAAISKKLTTGGRLGLLPFSNSSLELGVSYRNGNVGDANSLYKNVGAQMYALDLTYVKQFDFIKGLFDVKAQFNNAKVDNANYINAADSTGNSLYTFNNKRSSFFTQAAYRPTMSQSKILKKTEIIFRYAGFTPPIGAQNLEKIKQYTYGITYWFTWKTAFKAAYQSQKNNNAFFVQAAIGF